MYMVPARTCLKRIFGHGTSFRAHTSHSLQAEAPFIFIAGVIRMSSQSENTNHHHDLGVSHFKMKRNKEKIDFCCPDVRQEVGPPLWNPEEQAGVFGLHVTWTIYNTAS